MSADLAEVRAVLDRTRAVGTARVVLATDRGWALPQFPARQHGPVARALLGTGGAVSKAVGRRIYRLLASRNDPLHHPSGEGVVDLAGLRSMVDLGSYAPVVQVGGDQWSGRSGRALSTLPVDRMSTTSALWLLLLLPAF